MQADVVSGADVVGLAWSPAGYRVRFWAERPEPGWARAIEEWSISDVDSARDVIRWAEANARGRDVEIFAVVVKPEGVEHVRISGSDGDSDSGTSLTVTFTTEP